MPNLNSNGLQRLARKLISNVGAASVLIDRSRFSQWEAGRFLEENCMKSAVDVNQIRRKVDRGAWFLLGVPIATTILIATQSPWSLPAAPVEPQYRYPYPETLSQLSSIARIEQEIATYQQRLRDSHSAIDQAALATAYLKMARATGAGNWYLLADRAAQASLTKLPYDNVEAQIALARVAEAQHDFARSLQIAAQLPEADAIALQTTAYLATGKLLQANLAADRLVDATLSTNAFTLQAIVQLAQGKDEAALQSFQQAIAVEEPGELASSAQVRTLLGRYYFERGELDRAAALYREALRILPHSPQAKLNLAQLELRRGRYRHADRLYAEVTESAQGNATVFDSLILRGQAQIKLRQGDRAGAEQAWGAAETLLRQSFLGANTGSFGHRRDLARLLLERGRDTVLGAQSDRDLPEAISLLETELQTRRTADTLDTYAWALSRAGRWKDAQTAIQAAIAQGVQSAAVFDRAGSIERALGNSAQADRYFEQSRQIDPHFDDAARQSIGLGIGLGS